MQRVRSTDPRVRPCVRLARLALRACAGPCVRARVWGAGRRGILVGMSTFDELSRSIDVARSEITRVELGGPWGKHRRSVPGSARLYAALGGAGRVEVPGQPGQHVRLGPGELAFLPRNDEHVIRDAPATFIPRDGSACEIGRAHV